MFQGPLRGFQLFRVFKRLLTIFRSHFIESNLINQQDCKEMSGSLESYVGQPVIILSCDGRCFSGTLKGKIRNCDLWNAGINILQCLRYSWDNQLNACPPCHKMCHASLWNFSKWRFISISCFHWKIYAAKLLFPSEPLTILLLGFDQLINLILDDTHERIFSTTSGMEQISLGLKIIRGDNVSVIGLVDEAVEQSVDFTKIRGEPLNPVVH